VELDKLSAGSYSWPFTCSW